MTATTTPVRRMAIAMAAFAVAFVSFAFLATPEAEGAYPGGNDFIVFESDFDLWAVPSTGGAATKLTGLAPPAYLETEPVFSPDGKWVAFSRDVIGDAGIWVAEFDPSGPSLKTPYQQVSNGGDDGEPTWSPDGTMIAFERMNTTSIATGAADASAVVLTDADGVFTSVMVGHYLENDVTGAKGRVTAVNNTIAPFTVTANLAGGIRGITPDNSWLIGDTYAITPQRLQVFKAPVNGSNPAGTILSASGLQPVYDDATPAWAPSEYVAGSATILFATNQFTGNFDIAAMNPDGSNQQNLTPDPFDDNVEFPTWAPDGSAFAFYANEPNTAYANIWTMTVTVGASGNVTPGSTDNVTSGDPGIDHLDPAWSPDGELIAFRREGAGANGIFTVPSASTVPSAVPKLVTVSAATDGNWNPDWRPTLVGVNDSATVDENAEVVIPVLDNDKLLASALGAPTPAIDSQPANGTVVATPAGELRYTHDGSETTSDSFTYHPVQSGIAGTVATVLVVVTPVNDAPVAKDDGPYLVANGGTKVVAAPGVLGNDTDPDDSSLTAVKASDPAHGSVTLNSDGSFAYTHNGDSATSDSFTYTAKDDDGTASNTATVSIVIGDALPGVHTTGLVDTGSGKWYLYDDAGVATTSFFYGNPGDYPFMGDWDGDGVETPGLYRQSDGYVYLRNSNTVGIADIKFYFGNPGDVPIAGDFNGDGFDTVSIYRPSNQTFYIINKLGSNDGGLGAADFSYVFGNPGDKPFVGDFDGDGLETAGLHRESTGLVYFRNSHTQGNADAQFIFGDPGDRLVAGDWTDDTVFTPALYRPSNTTMYFRYSNTQGNADNQFIPSPTNPAWIPVSGRTN